MLNIDELRQGFAAITNVEGDIGSAVANNRRRFVYRVRFLSTFNGVNVLAIGKRENGAGATTWLDNLGTVVINEMETDPEELTEHSAPLFSIDGPPSGPNLAAVVGNSTMRAVCTQTGNLTYWYIDKES